MTDLIEKMARAIWVEAERNEFGSYVGDMGFPRGEGGTITTLDGQFDLSKLAQAAAKVLLEELAGLPSPKPRRKRKT